MIVKEIADIDEKVAQLVHAEMDRQVIKWGVQRHSPLLWTAILGEETGEVAKAVLDNAYQNKPHDPQWADYITELVQVAAVAQSAVRAMILQLEEQAKKGEG